MPHDKLTIVEVKTWPLRYKRRVPMFDARLGYESRESLLVEVVTNKGVTGIGEAAVFGGSLPVVAAAVRKLADLIIGENPLYVEKIWEKCYQSSWQWGQRGVFLMALSGIDIALWDIVGQLSELPLYQIFGACRDELPGYASGGFYEEGKNIADLQKECARYVEQGFKAVKIKVGRRPSEFLPLHTHCRSSLEEDVQRVKAVRQAIGDKVTLMLDANNAWDPKTAVKAIEHFEPFDPYFIEEPVPVENLSGSAWVKRVSRVPIAGYETLSIHARWGYQELLQKEAVDIVQFDVTWCGGLTEARKIAHLAAAHQLVCIPHCFSSAVALAATLHLLCSIPNSAYIEIDVTPNPLRDEIISEPFIVTNAGTVKAPKNPGLGIKMDWKAIKRYTIE